MVRTKAVAKAVGAKAPGKKSERPAVTIMAQNGDGKGRERAGGNLYCPRDIPGWQKPITSFFIQPNESGESSDEKRKEMKSQRCPDFAATSSTSDDSAGASMSAENRTRY